MTTSYSLIDLETGLASYVSARAIGSAEGALDGTDSTPPDRYSGWMVYLTADGTAHLLDQRAHVRAIGPDGIRTPTGAAGCWAAMLLRLIELEAQVAGTVTITADDVLVAMTSMHVPELQRIQAEVSGRLGYRDVQPNVFTPGPGWPHVAPLSNWMFGHGGPPLTSVGQSLAFVVSSYLVSHPETRWEQMAEFCGVTCDQAALLRTADLNWTQLQRFSQCLGVPYETLRGMA